MIRSNRPCHPVGPRKSTKKLGNFKPKVSKYWHSKRKRNRYLSKKKEGRGKSGEQKTAKRLGDGEGKNNG